VLLQPEDRAEVRPEPAAPADVLVGVPAVDALAEDMLLGERYARSALTT